MYIYSHVQPYVHVLCSHVYIHTYTVYVFIDTSPMYSYTHTPMYAYTHMHIYSHMCMSCVHIYTYTHILMYRRVRAPRRTRPLHGLRSHGTLSRTQGWITAGVFSQQNHVSIWRDTYMCVYIYVCMCVYICVCIRIYTCVYMRTLARTQGWRTAGFFL